MSSTGGVVCAAYCTQTLSIKYFGLLSSFSVGLLLIVQVMCRAYHWAAAVVKHEHFAEALRWCTPHLTAVGLEQCSFGFLV